MVTFLIIDDDKVDRMIIERTLIGKYPEVKCLHAASIRTARDITRETKVDLFLIDITLPDGSGFDCIDTLKCEPHYSILSTVLMSGEVRQSDKEAARILNIEKVLQKPMRRSENDYFAEQVYGVYKSFASMKLSNSAN